MDNGYDGVENLFIHDSAAKRYAAARPYFHRQVIDRILAVTGEHSFANALDIACGTGQSSRALAEIATEVAAIDISDAMLSLAEPHPRITYRVSSAEDMPFENARLDLATVGLAFHWFDQAAFLREASRVLKPGAWLVIYNSGFTGEMVESDEFRHRFWEAYLAQFPAPARRSTGASPELAESFGFIFEGREGFEHLETMTAGQFTEYLLTQTNVIAAVENGTMPLDRAAAWIHELAEPLFTKAPRPMKFVGTIWFLKLQPGAPHNP